MKEIFSRRGGMFATNDSNTCIGRGAVVSLEAQDEYYLSNACHRQGTFHILIAHRVRFYLTFFSEKQNHNTTVGDNLRPFTVIQS